MQISRVNKIYLIKKVKLVELVKLINGYSNFLMCFIFYGLCRIEHDIKHTHIIMHSVIHKDTVALLYT